MVADQQRVASLSSNLLLHCRSSPPSLYHTDRLILRNVAAKMALHVLAYRSLSDVVVREEPPSR